MKIGIELRIDVTKIDKARIYEGQKGKYLTMTAFVDLDQQDQYGNNGMITHKKEEGEQGQTPILGNTKVFWSDQPQQQSAPQQPQSNRPMQQPPGYTGQQGVNNGQPQPLPNDLDSEDIPF